MRSIRLSEGQSQTVLDDLTLGFNIEVQQVMVDRIPDAESGSPMSCAVASSTAAELAALLHP